MNQFNTRFWLGCGIAAVILLTATFAATQTPPPARGDIIFSGFLPCQVAKDSPRQYPFRLHYLELTEGRTYAIRIATTEFESRLAIEDLNGNVLATNDECIEGDLYGTLWFRAPANGRYRFVVSAVPPMREGFYAITVRELPIVMRVEAVLTMMDEAQDECHQRVHEVALDAGQLYVIELLSEEFTPGMKLLNPEGAVVAFDNEGTMSTPARIIYTAPRTGVYRLVTASTTPYSVGAFRLTVYQDE